MVRYLPPRKAKNTAVNKPAPAPATRRGAKKDGAVKGKPKKLRFADGPTIIEQQTPARAMSAPAATNAPTKSRAKTKAAALPQLSFTFKSAKSLPSLREPAGQSSTTAKGAKRRSASNASKNKAPAQDAVFDGLKDLADMACGDLEYYTGAIEDSLAASLQELGSSSGASPTRLFVECQANSSSTIPSYRDDSTCAEDLNDQRALKLLVDAVNAHEAGFLCNHVEARALSPGEQPVTVPADSTAHLDDASSVFMVVVGSPILLSVSGVSITLQPGSITRLGLESAMLTNRTVTPLMGTSTLITLRACSRFVDRISGQVVNALQTFRTAKGKKGTNK